MKYMKKAPVKVIQVKQRRMFDVRIKYFMYRETYI